jgi:hypothetical protein
VLVGSVEETVQRPTFELPHEVLRHRADQVRSDANADPVDCAIIALIERIPLRMLAAAIKNWTKSGSFRAFGTLLRRAMGHRIALAFLDYAAIAFAEFCSVSEIGLGPRSLKMRSPSQQRNRLPENRLAISVANRARRERPVCHLRAPRQFVSATRIPLRKLGDRTREQLRSIGNLTGKRGRE